MQNLTDDNKILTQSDDKLSLNEKHFEILNIQRIFFKKIKQNSSKIQIVKISQDELLHEVRSNKFVLISDNAGTGKSWAMKNITKVLCEKNPTSWVTYVNLKQFINEFKAQVGKTEFSSFMTQKILKLNHKFDSKIFQNLYKNGKVFIFFDGYDEIPSDCAEFVSNLAQSLESNGGNQLWISTHDSFEINLQQKLGIDIAYGLAKINDKDGINLMAKRWILMDLGDKSKIFSVQEFQEHFEVSSNYLNYKLKAEKIVQKVKIDWRLFAMPQMFKIIADGLKNDHNLDILNRAIIYEKCIKFIFTRWACERDEIEEEESIESQRLKLNFWRFHQFHAIAIKFQKLVEILFPDYNGKDFQITELTDAKILAVKNGKIYFPHETLQDYFIADILSESLKNEEINEAIIETFVDILTLDQYEAIRIFMNDSIESKNLLKIQPKMKNFQEKFNNFGIFHEYINENVKYLVDFVFSVFKDGDYEKVKIILENSSFDISRHVKSLEIFSKFQDFLCQFLSSEDLKIFIKSQKILLNCLRNENNLGIDIFSDFLLKIESNVGFEFAQEELRRTISDKWIRENNLDYIFNIRDPKVLKFRKFIKILQKFLPPVDVLQFLKGKDGFKNNFLFESVRKENKEFFEILWIETENCFAMQNKIEDFKRFVKQQNKYKRNIFHIIENCRSFEFYQLFWKILLNTFKDRKELKDFVMQKVKFENNFLHDLVSKNDNPKIIQWTLDILEQNFNDLLLQEIFKSKGESNRSLLHSLTFGKHNIKVYKRIWPKICNLCKSEQEFLKILKDVDKDGRNILNYAVCNSLVEVLNFFIDEFEKNYSTYEIKKILSNSDKWNRSLLHFAAENKSVDVFKAVWTNFQKYFTMQEIFEILNQIENFNSEIFLFYIESSETLEFVIKELKKIGTCDEIKKFFSSFNRKKLNILQKSIIWPGRKSLDFHETLWTILFKYFEKSEILNMIRNVDENGNNLFHIAVNEWISNEIVEYTWNKVKSFLSRDEQIEYLKMKGENGKNVIEFAGENKNWMKNLLNEYQIEY